NHNRESYVKESELQAQHFRRWRRIRDIGAPEKRSIVRNCSYIYAVDGRSTRTSHVQKVFHGSSCLFQTNGRANLSVWTKCRQVHGSHIQGNCWAARGDERGQVYGS